MGGGTVQGSLRIKTSSGFLGTLLRVRWTQRGDRRGRKTEGGKGGLMLLFRRSLGDWETTIPLACQGVLK